MSTSSRAPDQGTVITEKPDRDAMRLARGLFPAFSLGVHDPLPRELEPIPKGPISAGPDNFVAKFSPRRLEAANFGLKLAGAGPARRASMKPALSTSASSRQLPRWLAPAGPNFLSVRKQAGDISRLAFTTQGGGD